MNWNNTFTPVQHFGVLFVGVSVRVFIWSETFLTRSRSTRSEHGTHGGPCEGFLLY